jgi:putrescine importer
VLILGSFGAAFTGQAGAARLLFGMGRAGALPSRFFSHLSAGTLQPSRNLLLIGLVSVGAASLLSFEQAGELLNFGAFLAFLGVNLSALRCGLTARRGDQRVGLVWIVLPAIGALSCFAIWISLPSTAWLMGLTWLAVGLAYHLVFTRGRHLPGEFPIKGGS